MQRLAIIRTTLASTIPPQQSIRTNNFKSFISRQLQQVGNIRGVRGRKKMDPSVAPTSTAQQPINATNATNTSQSSRKFTPEIEEAHSLAMSLGKSSYVDPQTGYNVFTEKFHLDRGTCCGSMCRHCPFDHKNVPERRKKMFASSNAST